MPDVLTLLPTYLVCALVGLDDIGRAEALPARRGFYADAIRAEIESTEQVRDHPATTCGRLRMERQGDTQLR